MPQKISNTQLQNVCQAYHINLKFQADKVGNFNREYKLKNNRKKKKVKNKRANISRQDWKMLPHCVIWCLWRERNARIFEHAERQVHELKLLFFHTLFDWVMGSGISSIHSMLELIDLCKF
jgi:hypothetical protein